MLKWDPHFNVQSKQIDICYSIKGKPPDCKEAWYCRLSRALVEQGIFTNKHWWPFLSCLSQSNNFGPIWSCIHRPCWPNNGANDQRQLLQIQSATQMKPFWVHCLCHFIDYLQQKVISVIYKFFKNRKQLFKTCMSRIENYFWRNVPKIQVESKAWFNSFLFWILHEYGDFCNTIFYWLDINMTVTAEMAIDRWSMSLQAVHSKKFNGLESP